MYSTGRRIPLGANLQTLCIRVRLEVFHTFVRVYPLTIPFFLGARPTTIPASVFIGSMLGFFLCLTIDFGNREVKDRKNLPRFALAVRGRLDFGVCLLVQLWMQLRGGSLGR